MKTVKELKEELANFPDDSVVFAFDECKTGIAIARPGQEINHDIILLPQEDVEEPPYRRPRSLLKAARKNRA